MAAGTILAGEIDGGRIAIAGLGCVFCVGIPYGSAQCLGVPGNDVDRVNHDVVVRPCAGPGTLQGMGFNQQARPIERSCVQMGVAGGEDFREELAFAAGRCSGIARLATLPAAATTSTTGLAILGRTASLTSAAAEPELTGFAIATAAQRSIWRDEMT